MGRTIKERMRESDAEIFARLRKAHGRIGILEMLAEDSGKTFEEYIVHLAKLFTTPSWDKGSDGPGEA